MKRDIDHETCSELLAPFVAGQLEPADAEAVAEHLEACGDCRAERRGVERLLADEVRPLSEHERTRLHDAVAAAIRSEGGRRPSADVIPHAPRGWRSRLAPLAAAAAAVVLIAIGAWWAAGTVGGGDAGPSALDGGGGESAATRGAAEQLEAAGPEPVFGGKTGADAFTALAPAVGAAKELDRTEDAIGTEEDPEAPFRRSRAFFAPYARAYRPDQAGELQTSFVDRLASQAGSGDDGELLKKCAAQVISQQSGAILPVYGSYGIYRGKDVLILGFVWAAGDSDEFDRFMYWAWPRTSCDRPILNRTGTLEHD
jgi:anti-sigma factor RsiW